MLSNLLIKIITQNYSSFCQHDYIANYQEVFENLNVIIVFIGI